MSEQQQGVTPEQLKKLADKFPATDIEWRVGMSKISGDNPWVVVLAYITNRAIMERLDCVCGPEHWRNEYLKTPNDPSGNSCVCGISVRVHGEWITKWDGADNSQTEPVKGGLSDAMKRAAVQWGIGRYLYDLGTNYANVTSQKSPGAKKLFDKSANKTVWWTPPTLPSWALPGGDNSPPPKTQPKPKTNGKRPESRAELLDKCEKYFETLGVPFSMQDALIRLASENHIQSWELGKMQSDAHLRALARNLHNLWAENQEGGEYVSAKVMFKIDENEKKTGARK